MLIFALGLGALVWLLWAARAFSRASVTSVKALLAWVAALAGLSLAVMLLLTGRIGAALSMGVLLGPLLWNWWQRQRGSSAGQRQARPTASGAGRMTRQEALEVLGLTDPVTEAEVRAAWMRLMRIAHPDAGGSDWLGARVNQAKDVLLGR